jgi:hypothetical protein
MAAAIREYFAEKHLGDLVRFAEALPEM